MYLRETKKYRLGGRPSIFGIGLWPLKSGPGPIYFIHIQHTVKYSDLILFFFTSFTLNCGKCVWVLGSVFISHST